MDNRLADIRKERGLSQQELAELSGVCRPYISTIETTPNKEVSNTVMFKLAKALNVGIEDIFLP